MAKQLTKRKLIVVTNTVITPYSGNVKIKPKSPAWIIKNTSTEFMQVNGGQYFYNNEQFGVDATNVFAMVYQMAENGVQVEFENNTQLEVTFNHPTNITGGGSFSLIETYINYKWEQ